jgi:anhydro-N-acetylmuramic acid kinase
MMSGTSADGIDVALVRFSRGKASFEDFIAFPLDPCLRQAVLNFGEGRPITTAELSQLNFRLGEEFAAAVLAACRKFRVATRSIAVIGSHGQTVFHQGAATAVCGRAIRSTLQIGEPSIIAARTGITTVGDFRPADMAAGGQGAPLVPFVDFLLYRHRSIGRAALNIGGIANLTVIPPAADRRDVIAFDTGPGNMVIDALVSHFSNGQDRFDKNSEIAAQGALLPELMEWLLRDPYLSHKPPKTAGREQYGSAYVAEVLRHPASQKAKAEDIIRTATLATAFSILDAMHRLLPRNAGIRELIVSGGGARNPLLMAQLQAGLRDIRVRRSGEFGIPEDAKEAYAFAVLGFETLHRRPANLPAATGAKRPAILGKVCYALV